MASYSVEEYIKYIPCKDDITFIPRLRSPTAEEITEYISSFNDSHTHQDGKFRDGGVTQLKVDSERYRIFRETFYHKVIYKDLDKMSAVAYRNIPDTALQEKVSARCNVLEAHFPPGRFGSKWSIVDESCIFYKDQDGIKTEIACYDRSIRLPCTSADCSARLLDTLMNARRPDVDKKRHLEVSVTRPCDPNDEEERKHIEQTQIRHGVKHPCWAWIPRISDQGPVVSRDLCDPEFKKQWLGGLGRALKPLLAQASTVVYARDAKDWGWCWQSVCRAAGSSGSRGMLLSLLDQIPFNGCAIVCLENTTDHKDSMNQPGAYGACQPIGKYPLGEGSLTLLQLGVVLLYQPTDTVCADFLRTSHFTRSLTKGYRYCLTSFLHRKIYEFRQNRDAKDTHDSKRQKFIDRKEACDRRRLMKKRD